MEIEEFSDQLVIRSEVKRRIWYAVGGGALSAAAIAVFMGIAFAGGWRSGGATWVGSSAAGFGLAEGFLIWRGGRAELRVSKLEFVMRGGGKKTPKSVCLADVEYLQWEEGARRHPEGLYARVGLGSTCLLPYVNAQEVTEIIGRIGAKFPHCRL
jgi:hypothetical protein